MLHPIEEQIKQAADTVRQHLRLQTWTMVIASIVAICFLLVAFDYSTRIESQLIRWLTFVVCCSAIGLIIALWLIPTLRIQLDDLFVAQLIERRFRQLGNRLTTSIDFLRHDEDAGTSTQLKQNVIEQTSNDIKNLDFDAIVDRDGTRKVLILTGILGLVFLAVAASSPTHSWIGLKRLSQPWKKTPWPRRHQLVLNKLPSAVVAGGPITVSISDQNGTPPDDVRVILRLDGIDQTKETVYSPDSSRVSATFLAPTSNFSIRATGGDDDSMAWREVRVVEPNFLDDLTLLITPPTYANRPTVDVGPGKVNVLEDSRLRFSGSSDLALKAAKLELSDVDPLPGKLLGKGRKFQIPAGEIPLLAKQSARARIVTLDSRGVETRSPDWQIHVVPDKVPIARVLLSNSLPFLPNAFTPIRCVATDDVGLQSITFKVNLDSAANPIIELADIELWSKEPEENSSRNVRDKNIEHRLTFSKLDGVEPGSKILLRIDVTDRKGQTVESQRHSVDIVSADQFDARLALEQRKILDQLVQSRDIAKETTNQLNVAIQSAVENNQNANERSLRLAISASNTVHRQLLGQETSIESQIRSLGEHLLYNELEDSDASKRLRRAAASINHLEAPLSRQSNQIARLAEKPATISMFQIEQLLEQATMIVDQLDLVITDFDRWDTSQQVAIEMADILRKQISLVEETDRLRISELTDSNPQDGNQLAKEQNTLGHRFDRAEQRLRDLLTKSTESSEENDMVALAEEAIRHSREHAVSGMLKQSAENISAKRFSVAKDQELEAILGLRDIVQSLGGNISESNNLDRARVLTELEDLANEQSAIADALNANPNGRDNTQLSEAQRTISERLAELANTLRETSASDVASDVSDAQNAAEDASDAIEEGDIPSARDLAQTAQQRINSAKEKLQTTTGSDDSLISDLRNLLLSQSRILKRTKELAQHSSNELREEIDAVAKQQIELADLGVQLGTTQSGALQISIESVSSDMTAAGESLSNDELGEVTQQRQNSAIDQTAQIISALSQSPEGQARQPRTSDDSSTSLGEQTQIPFDQQIKLLLSMQDRINARTEELASSGDDSLSTAKVQQLEQLTTLQRKIADAARRLAKDMRPAENPQNQNPAPENLDELDAILESTN